LIHFFKRFQKDEYRDAALAGSGAATD